MGSTTDQKKPKFDQKSLAGYKPEKRETLYDHKTPGLVLRVTPTGSKTYYFVYRMGGRDTKKKWISIGDFKELPLVRAQEKAKEYSVQVDHGKDPGEILKAKAHEGKTIADLAKRFKEDYLPGLAARTQEGYEDCIDLHILPALGKIPIQKLEPERIRSWHRKIKGNRVANLSLAVLSCMLTQAVEWKMRPLSINPCKAVKRHEETVRARDVQPRELKALGKALKDLEGEYTPWALGAIKVAALCWARLSEVLALRRDQDVHLDEGYAIVRDHKGKKKQGPKRVELPPPVVEILKGLPEVVGNPHFFVAPRTKDGHITRHGLRETWVAVRDRAGVPDLHIHDFRSLAASEGEAQGVSPKTMAAVLGHSDVKTTMKHYARVRKSHSAKVAAEIAAPIAVALGI